MPPKRVPARVRRRAEQFRTERCDLCGKPVVTKLHLDHSHEDESVRGWIHPVCNWRLGKIKDDVEWLEAAARYLRNPPARTWEVMPDASDQ